MPDRLAHKKGREKRRVRLLAFFFFCVLYFPLSISISGLSSTLFGFFSLFSLAFVVAGVAFGLIYEAINIKGA